MRRGYWTARSPCPNMPARFLPTVLERRIAGKSMSTSEVTRRQILLWASGSILSARIVPAIAAGAVEISPQPYFAGVKRALEALERVGAPVAPKDAEQIAALARQEDGSAVNA